MTDNSNYKQSYINPPVVSVPESLPADPKKQISYHADNASTASLSYSHPLERWVQRKWVRYILAKLTAERSGTALPHLHAALQSYGDPQARLYQKLMYWPIHKVLDYMRGSFTRRQLREKIAGHPPTLRGIIATSRSVAHFGLSIPQRWLNPLFAVWNFTNSCNLRCAHCYQSSTAKPADQELALSEKLALIDQFGHNYVAMVAFAGGEPTLSDDLEPALARLSLMAAGAVPTG